MNIMLEHLWKARKAFLHVQGKKKHDLKFWLDMLQCQLDEATQHLENNKDEKALAEIADTILVAFQAIHEHADPIQPETYVAYRIKTRVLPRIHHLVHTYRNGYKEVKN